MKAWVLIPPLLLCSCSSVGKLLDLSKARPPALTVTPTPHGPAVVQTGDTASPAQVVTTETQASVPVVPGSVITITPPGDSPTQPVTLTTRSTAITGPRSFTPPPPPTPGQLANADGIRQSYYFAGALILGAGFLFWRGHVKAALVALVCGITGPILANFSGSDLAQKVLIGGACVAGALFAAWHFMQDKQPKPNV